MAIVCLFIDLNGNYEVKEGARNFINPSELSEKNKPFASFKNYRTSPDVSIDVLIEMYEKGLATSSDGSVSTYQPKGFKKKL